MVIKLDSSLYEYDLLIISRKAMPINMTNPFTQRIILMSFWLLIIEYTTIASDRIMVKIRVIIVYVKRFEMKY